MFDSKLVATPMSTIDEFLSIGIDFSDPTYYRSLVGALQYLIITGPGLSSTVNQASQFLHAPTTSHLWLVKRIL